MLPASECQPARVLLEPWTLFAFCAVLVPRAIQSRLRRSRGHGRLLQRQLPAVEAWMELGARVPRPPSSLSWQARPFHRQLTVCVRSVVAAGCADPENMSGCFSDSFQPWRLGWNKAHVYHNK
jgi:hypothetical protein